MENFWKSLCLTGGYYTDLTNYGKIRLVALNTNLYYSSNKLVAKISDPAGQLTWLDGVLTKAKINHEKVGLPVINLFIYLFD